MPYLTTLPIAEFIHLRL